MQNLLCRRSRRRRRRLGSTTACRRQRRPTVAVIDDSGDGRSLLSPTATTETAILLQEYSGSLNGIEFQRKDGEDVLNQMSYTKSAVNV
ncbi:hypothetical protein Y032_0420g1151 [Ancylostoma ceylanicum]|uniref:Uncharacterized protein n=1 Tax=Ancylostoma ceylanicum TaxID=53326 RepID=A0A016X2D1_9BILA|nr:hypothetical protein Y032_0420g1151 [Ancylostoma ceylanicum]